MMGMICGANGWGCCQEGDPEWRVLAEKGDELLEEFYCTRDVARREEELRRQGYAVTREFVDA